MLRPAQQLPTVRPYSSADLRETVSLLYESSGGMYDRYAGSRPLAERALRRALQSERTTASGDVVWVAEGHGRAIAAMAAMPYDEWTPRAVGFLRATLRSIPPWRWPGALWLYRATGRTAPEPPISCMYVDSLATDPGHRRQGAARALLAVAEEEARRKGLRSLALDTWIDNRPARALYLAEGFEEVAYTPAISGLPGGVSLMKEL
jgi:GNAT superfamily N-acetyltransferase